MKTEMCVVRQREPAYHRQLTLCSVRPPASGVTDGAGVTLTADTGVLEIGAVGTGGTGGGAVGIGAAAGAGAGGAAGAGASAGADGSEGGAAAADDGGGFTAAASPSINASCHQTTIIIATSGTPSVL